jgi:hypothetical protein
MKSDGVHRTPSTFRAIFSPFAILRQSQANSADISKAKLLKPDRQFESLSDRHARKIRCCSFDNLSFSR